MKLRAEVEEALTQIEGYSEKWVPIQRFQLLALVELGVRLALAKAAETAREAYVPIIAYFGDDGHEGLRNAATDILSLTPADILQAQPGAEEE